MLKIYGKIILNLVLDVILAVFTLENRIASKEDVELILYHEQHRIKEVTYNCELTYRLRDLNKISILLYIVIIPITRVCNMVKLTIAVLD